MNPVVDLDISKGESQVQAFLDKGKPYRKSFKVNHTLEGLNDLFMFLGDVQKEAGKKPTVMTHQGETNHLWRMICLFFFL